MAQQAFYTKINAGAGVQFSGGTIAQATAVLHTNNVLYLRGGSAGLYLQNADGSDGIFAANDHVQITTASAERLRVTSAGKIGIGTSSPNELLEIKPTSGNDAKINMVNSSGTLKALIGYDNSNGGLINLYNESGTLNVVVRGYGNSYFNGGNFGIGTNNPNQKLEVASGNINIQNGDGGFLTFNNGDANIVINYNGTGRDLSFKTYDGSSNAERMRITKAGKVGIGTDSPAFDLEVFRGDNSTTAIGIGNSGTAPSRLYIDAANGDFSGSDYMWIGQDNDKSGEIFMAQNSGSFNIKTQPSGTSTTQFTVTQAGNISFGSYGSGSKTGTAAYNLQVDSSGNIIETAAGGSGTVTGSGTATYLPIWTSGSALGNSIISSSGGDITINGSDNDPRIYINPAGGDIGDTALVQFNSRGHVGYTSGLVELGDNGQSKDVRLRVNTADIILQTSNTTRMTVKSDGLVGIGTTSPTGVLDVLSTDAQRYARFRAPNGEERFEFHIGSTGNGARLSMFDHDGTTEGVRLSASGNSYLNNSSKLGINTNSPSRTLHIAGAGGSSGGIMIAPTSGDAEIQFQDSGVTNAYITLDDGTQDLNFRDDSATVMTIDFGNERVGVGNTSPQYALDVAGVIKGTSSIRVDAGSPYFGLYNSGTEKAYLQWSQTGSVLTLQSDGAINYTSGGLQKWTISGSEKMTLNTDGELGINQSNPRAKLEIYNTAVTSDADYSASETPSGQDSIILYSGGTAENTYGSISWVTGGRRRAMITAVSENADTDYQGIAFYTQGTDGSGDFYESMRIKHSGQISFYDYRGTNNTGTPTYLLGTDANGLMVKTNSSSHLPGGPYLPLAGGTLTGPLTIEDSLSSPNPLLTLYNDTNGGGSTIKFGDHTGQTQTGNLSFYHSDGASQGGGATFQFLSTEADMTLQVGGAGKASRVVVWSANSQTEVDYGFAGDVNTGMTRIGADQVGLIAGGNLGVYASTTAVWLKNNGNTKLATTSTGVAITGNADVSSNVLVGGADSYFGENVLRFKSAGAAYIDHNTTGQSIIFRTSNSSSLDTTALTISSAGYATFGSGISATNTSFSGTMNIAGGIYHIGDTDTFFGFIGGNDTFGLTTGGGSRMDANNAGVRFGGSGARIGSVLDEDTMSSNSDTALATQQSIKAYVDNSISGATVYQGTWDPSSGTYGSPDLSTASLQVNGYYYICSANGSATPNGAATEPDSWHVGDWVIWNDDLGSSGLWQKIDNTSVISGAGTGQKVVKWDGSGTSETLTDGPVTFSGNNSTFTGNITTGDDGSVIGGDGTISLYARSTGSVSYIQIQNSSTGTNTSADGLTIGNNGTAAYVWQREQADLRLGTNDTLALTIDSSQDALFASDVAITAKLAVGATSVHASYDLYNQGTFYSNGAATINANLTVDAGSISISGDGANFATLTETGAGLLTIAAVDDVVIDSGSDITLDAAGNDIRFFKSGVEYGKFKQDSSNFDIFASVQDKDIRFKGNDGGSTITALTLDMSDAGKATFNNGWSSDGEATQYTWRLPNTSSNANYWYKIARVTSSQSTRFKLQMVGAHSYSDGYYSSETNAYGQLNNDDNYDLIFHRLEADNQSGDPVIAFGQVDVDSSSTDLYVQIGTFAELVITASISNGDLYPDTTSTGSSTTPTNFVAATEQFGILSPTIFQSTVRLDSQLLDGTNDAGTSGQILSSTGSVTNWVDASAVIGGPYLPLSGGTLTGDVTFTGDTHNVMWDKSANALEFWDNAKLTFGDPGGSPNLELYHDGSHSYIDNDHTGDLYVRSLNDDVVIQAADDVFIYTQAGEDAIIARGNGGVELYYDNSKKLETTSAGIDITGGISMNDSILIDYTGSDGQNNDAGLKIMNDGSDWGAYIRKDNNANYGLRIDSGGSNALSIYSTTGGSTKTFGVNGSNGDTTLGALTSAGNGTFAGKIKSTETPADLASAPTIAFGDGDTGFYERSDDDLRLSIGGAGTWEFSANCMGNVNQGKAHFNSETATATNPSIIPWRNDADTGIGRGSADVLSLIAGGVEALSLSTTTATFAENLAVAQTKKILFDGGSGHTYMSETSDSNLKLFVAGGEVVNFTNDFVQFNDDINPALDSTYNLGTNSVRWSNIWVDNINGGTPTTGGPYLPLSGGTMTGNVVFDGVANNLSKTLGFAFGNLSDSPALMLYAYQNTDIGGGLGSSTGSMIINNLGSTGLVIRNTVNDADITFQNDDGNGDITTYFYLDGSQTNTNFQKDIIFADSKKALFGGSGDLQIYHDGSNSYIDETGTGSLYIKSAGAIRLQSDTGENMIYCVNDGAVNLYHNNVNVFATASDGVIVKGDSNDITFVNNSASDHNYLKVFVPDTTVNALGVSQTNVYIPLALEVDGVVTLNNNLQLQDSDSLQIGNSQDLEIYHASGNSNIDNKTGHLYIRANVGSDTGSNIYIQAKSGENSIICNDDSSVNLYFNNSAKFYTHGSGVGAAGYYGFGSTGTSTGSSYYYRYGSVSAGATQGLIITTSDTGGSYFDGVAQFRNTNTGQGAGMFQMINFGALYGRYINFYRGSTSNIIGYIGYNATNTAVTYSTSSSDIRLKKNIVTWDEEVLPKFLALTPKKFDFKAAVGDKGADKVKGFIAQYETENFPEVYQLNGNGQDARYGFHPMEMVPYLMKAVKELAEKNEDLERRLAALEK